MEASEEKPGGVSVLSSIPRSETEPKKNQKEVGDVHET